MAVTGYEMLRTEPNSGVIYDDVFWRDAERWIRTSPTEEYRLLDLAPELERMWLLKYGPKSIGIDGGGGE
jgi:hypothetical protein